MWQKRKLKKGRVNNGKNLDFGVRIYTIHPNITLHRGPLQEP